MSLKAARAPQPVQAPAGAARIPGSSRVQKQSIPAEVNSIPSIHPSSTSWCLLLCCKASICFQPSSGHSTLPQGKAGPPSAASRQVIPPTTTTKPSIYSFLPHTLRVLVFQQQKDCLQSHPLPPPPPCNENRFALNTPGSGKRERERRRGGEGGGRLDSS